MQDKEKVHRQIELYRYFQLNTNCRALLIIDRIYDIYNKFPQNTDYTIRIQLLKKTACSLIFTASLMMGDKFKDIHRIRCRD